MGQSWRPNESNRLIEPRWISQFFRHPPGALICPFRIPNNQFAKSDCWHARRLPKYLPLARKIAGCGICFEECTYTRERALKNISPDSFNREQWEIKYLEEILTLDEISSWIAPNFSRSNRDKNWNILVLKY